MIPGQEDIKSKSFHNSLHEDPIYGKLRKLLDLSSSCQAAASSRAW